MFKVFVTGVGTEVGKTWMTSQLINQLKNDGYKVKAKKPLQSFEPDDFKKNKTDGQLLAAETGQYLDEVVLSSFELAMAPPMAAKKLSLPIADTQKILQFCKDFSEEPDICFIEGAGGLLSPLTLDGDNLEFLKLLRPNLVIAVAISGLGVINLVKMTAGYLSEFQVAFFLNYYDSISEVHKESFEWLTRVENLNVFISLEELKNYLKSQLAN